MSRHRPWHGVAAPAPPTQYRRLAMMTGLLLAGFGLLGVRLVDLHVVRGPQLRGEAQRILLQRQYFTPYRGEILDRRGEVLARSILVKEVKADPSLVGPRYAPFLAGLLAGPLGMGSEDLAGRLAQNTWVNKEGGVVRRQYVRLRRGVTYEEWAEVRSTLVAMDPNAIYPGVHEDGRKLSRREREVLRRDFIGAIATEDYDQQTREYPRGRLASHVLGFVGENTQQAPGSPYLLTGVEGVEWALNSVLEGVGGWRTSRVVRRGVRQVFREDVEHLRPRHGRPVMLTLDARLQAIVEEEMAAAWQALSPAGISVVMVDPRSGEILAMANLPDFDPNDLRRGEAEARWNRAISIPYEPGSTAKVMTYGLALEEGLLGWEDPINCYWGRHRFGRVLVEDVTKMGVVPTQVALAKSSNIAASQIGLHLGKARLHDGLARFGMGQRTGILLSAESAGGLRHWNLWDDQGWTLTRVTYGYAFLATPLQMTMAMAAVANEGRLMHPMIVRRIGDPEGQAWPPFEPQVRARAISPEAARELTWGLRAVVQPGGTGWRAALPHHTVAGKTGTTVKDYQNRAQEHRQYFSSFVGFFPAEDPQLCVGVFIDEPRGLPNLGGGATAAPVFRQIANRAAESLGIPPSPAGAMPRQSLAQETVTRPLTRQSEGSRM